MYESVHAAPDGERSVAWLVETASEYGFDGVVLRTRSDARSDADLASIADEVGVDVVDGVEIRAKRPQEASGTVGNARTSHTIVAVEGGTPALNRFAVENEKVDVLARPMAGEGDFNHVLAKAAVENGVRIEFDFGPVLRTSGGRRVRTLQSMRKLGEIVDYYDAPYVVTAGVRSHLQFRGPRELCAVGALIGFDREWVESGLREWGRLAERNRHVTSRGFVEPGVHEGRYEDR